MLLVLWKIVLFFYQVVVCGGSAKIPLLQKKLRDYFTNAEILNSTPPDEVLAVGAAKQVSTFRKLIFTSGILSSNMARKKVARIPEIFDRAPRFIDSGAQ